MDRKVTSKQNPLPQVAVEMGQRNGFQVMG